MRPFTQKYGIVVGLLLVVAPCSADAALWCAQYSYGATNCGFSTQSQCLATVSGVGGSCSPTGDAEPTKRPSQRDTAAAKERRKEKEAARPANQPAIATPAAPAEPAAPTPVATKPDAVPFAAARKFILDGNYEAGLTAMWALGRDNDPDVASYVGLALRKLGRIEEAKVWFDRALKADPNHKLTLSFYGMLHAEQGDLPGARGDLQKIKNICGNTTCNEYVGLAGVIAAKTH
jgi:tetratricopeptide (TPR) repeat protein